MEELQHIGANLDRGISVFYELIYLCTYSMGYIPGEKQLPLDDDGLMDELHEERRLGSTWILREGIGIRDRLVPMLKDVCQEFEGAYRLVIEEKELTKECAKQCFSKLGDVVDRFSETSAQMKAWIQQVENLHHMVQSREKPYTPGQEGYYSWQDAALKLQQVIEEADKMNVSWTGMSMLAADTVKELDKAQSSPKWILQKVFLEAAKKQWEDITEISQSITDIMRSYVERHGTKV